MAVAGSREEAKLSKQQQETLKLVLFNLQLSGVVSSTTTKKDVFGSYCYLIVSSLSA